MSTHGMEGHCLCRAIVFECDAEPSCRRATSSPMTTWISVPRGSFRFRQGTPRHFGSSPGVKRGFCRDCGSPLTYENERIPEEVHLYAALLTDPSLVKPTRHVFVEEQLPWFETADDLPRFARTSRSGAQPIRRGPRTS